MPVFQRFWKGLNWSCVVTGPFMCGFCLWATWKTLHDDFQIPQLGSWTWTVSLAGFFAFFYSTIDAWQKVQEKETPEWLKPEKQWAIPWALYIMAVLFYFLGYYSPDRTSSWMWLSTSVACLLFGLWLRKKVPPRPPLQ